MQYGVLSQCRFTGKWIPVLEVDPTSDERRGGRFPGLLITEFGRLPRVHTLVALWPTSPSLQLRAQLRVLTGFPLSSLAAEHHLEKI